jgi:hypothetical protein
VLATMPGQVVPNQGPTVLVGGTCDVPSDPHGHLGPFEAMQAYTATCHIHAGHVVCQDTSLTGHSSAMLGWCSRASPIGTCCSTLIP